MSAQEVADYGLELLRNYAPEFLMAVVVLLLGFWVIKLLTKGSNRMMEKRNMDDALRKFLRTLVNVGLKIALVISVLGMVGIEMTSFIALLGAAGLAIGMALSGTLQNFAGGVMLLLLRPFRIGDYIQAQGYGGTVLEIGIFHTLMNTPDNKRVILPNAPVSTGAIVNFSAEENRRLDLVFGISYTDDIDKAKRLLSDLIRNEARFLDDPEPVIGVSELGDSSVDLIVKAWLKGAEYFPVMYDFREEVKKTFDKEGVSIPFPQRDVHLHQNTN